MEVVGSWGGISTAMKRAEVVRCCDCMGECGTKAIEGLTNKRAATEATENFIVNVCVWGCSGWFFMRTLVDALKPVGSLSILMIRWNTQPQNLFCDVML